jgi:hypothetical protein
MATLAMPRPAAQGDDGFFLTMAFVMAGTIVAGFGLQLAAGRSSFGAPAIGHVHAVVFMGWMVIYLLQSWFATKGPIALHRRLGWLATAWLALMIVMGIAVTVFDLRRAHTPFVFQPLHFLVFDPMTVIGAAGLIWAGVSQRRHTDWHRRLNYSGMALLTGPAWGRLLPMPLLVPWAYQAAFLGTLLFWAVAAVADWRRDGRVHPALWWGLGAMLGTELVTDLVTYSPVGLALYQLVTAGSPGAAVPPLAFPPPPAG